MMKTFTKSVILILIFLSGLSGADLYSQSVIDPSDPVVTYVKNSPIPTQPPPNTIGKWVRTKRLSWNTDSYKCYIINGSPFRLKFPKTYNHNTNDGKVYPMIIMFHGKGEVGPVTDNEYQLYHGGERHRNFVDNGQFDGYVLFMQSLGYWGGGHYNYIRQIIDYMVANNKLDPFRISVHGLSAGGHGAWEFTNTYPTLVAAALPMSGISIGYKEAPTVNKLKFQQMWNFNGGADYSPAPSTCDQVKDAFLAAGGNYKNTVYWDLGHDVWNRAYQEPDFVPFMNRAHKANPWPLFGRTEFCPGDPINVTMGVTPGFDGYEWRKDGVIIPNATSNQITVTTVGTYECRVKRGNLWSPWSPTPCVISIKQPTVPPPITVSDVASKVIPAADGKTSVQLEVPDGYATYLWQKVGSSQTLSTTRFLEASTPGDYRIRVTETFGCSSDFSAPFTVVDANGPNKPDAAISLVATTLSKTEIRLDWSDNPNPAYNETAFEIYRSESPGGPYTFMGTVGADVLTYTSDSLHSNTKYFFRIRAVNNTGAAALSNEASATTNADSQAPSAPANLTITGTTPSSIMLSWDAADDDVEVVKYFVYVNGQKAYITTKTNIAANNLETGKTYTFTVKAVDFANNVSPASNQVSGQAGLMGLKYKQYVGTWSVLPNFANLTPVATGTMPTVAITPRTQNDNFGFLWEGYLKVPQTGTYTFRLRSDDGSKLYLGQLNGVGSPYSHTATPIVNHDNAHSASDKDGSPIFLQAGVYPFAATFFEASGGEEMTVSWKLPGTSSFTPIPASAFTDAIVADGQAPVAPSLVVAQAVSYRQINLTWKDNSNNESGFEILRSTDPDNGFVAVGVAPANSTSYADSSVSASTRYYYRVRSINQYGESNYAYNVAYSSTEAHWRFNNNYADSSGNGRTATPNGGPTFDSDAADKREGSHSLYLSGGNSRYINLPSTGGFLQNAYDKKTVSFWMKSLNNTGNRVIIDIGGNDDGIVIYLNNNRLYAAIAATPSGSSVIRKSINAAYNYSTSTWVHVAVVYNQSSLKLYLNGVEAAADNNLGFNSVNTTSNGSRIGANTGNNATNGTLSGLYNGYLDDFRIIDGALHKDEVVELMNTGLVKESFATTAALPAAPTAPDNLVATGTSTTAITVTWADKAVNETAYELYKSSNVNTNFVLYATLPANTTSYKDSGLFSNSVHYYKVRAIGVGGASAYSNEDSGRVLNNIPVITQVGDRSARYETSTVINLTAVDNDGDPITFSIQNKPSFVMFTDNGDKTATLTINPAVADQGIYNNIQITAIDSHNGSDVTTFKLTVNDNWAPVINAIPAYSVNEGATITIPLTATDGNAGDALTWTVAEAPASYTITPVSNGVANLQITPGFGAAGSYPVTVNVSDGKGGVASKSFTLTINDKDPVTKIYTRIAFARPVAGGPWNDLTGGVTNNLKDADGNITNIGLTFSPANWWAPHNGGPITGDNSGIYPDAVLHDYLFFGIFGNPETIGITVRGLDPAKTYSFTFFSSSIWYGTPDNGNTTYTIGNTTVSLAVQNNTQNTVSINDVTPEPDGTILITLAKASNAMVGYLNGLVITEMANDGTNPIAPNNFTVQNAPGQGVKLTWTDVAYNESKYEIYRSTSADGPFSLLNPTAPANSTEYVDGNINGGVTYYYKMRGVNQNGASDYTEVLSATTSNRVPSLAAINGVSLKNNQTATINVTAEDDPTDHITLSVSNLPTFATFVDNGDGTGVISIQPTAGSVGLYQNIIVTATDNSDSSRSVAFDVNVTDKDVTSYYVNFTEGNNMAKKPWNNFAMWPSPNATLSNLKDDGDANSNVSVTFLDGWENMFNFGMRPGNGTLLYPEAVSRIAYIESSSNVKRIRVSGLNTAKRYNFVFFNSHDFGVNGNTRFIINNDTVVLDAAYNVNKTVQINGITPAANGEVLIRVMKAPGAELAFLNSLVIQSYDPSLDLLTPADLRITETKVNSVKLQWADRSYAETGFEIWRATNTNTTYQLLATVGAKATSYTDNNLTPGRSYYYTVRAKKNSTYSSYTPAVGTTTLSYNVYINFTSNDIAPAPWNNTEFTPDAGHAIADLHDDKGIQTSLGFEVTKSFSEIQPLGMFTGNDSGVFPDNVIKKTYCVFPGVTGAIKVTGLHLGMKYNLTLFGSSGGWGDHTSAYYINGKKYVHNAAINIGNGLLVVYGIEPDENGEIHVTVMRENSYSLGGYLCGIIVSGYYPSTANTPNPPASGGSGARVANSTIVSNDVIEIPVNKEMNVYPNPFSQHINVSVPSSLNDKVAVSIHNIKGQQVYFRKFENLSEGRSLLQIQSNSGMAAPGVYIMKVAFINRPGSQTFKLIKR